jgi:phosphoenolpyruvate-protein phosphotransferase
MQLKGIPASAGVAWGRALQIPASPPRRDTRTVAPPHVAAELIRFDEAVDQSGRALAYIKQSLVAEGRAEEAEIIEIQIFLLKDRELIGKARDKISRLLYTSQAALEEAMAEVLHALRLLDPVSFQERTQDIEDVVRRIIRVLRGEKGILEGIAGTEGLVLICDNLSPSEAVLLNPRTISGVAVVSGSAASHFAIIARSIGIPAVVGIGQRLQDIRDGQLVLLNGTSGTVTVDPSGELLDECDRTNAELACGPQGVAAIHIPLPNKGDDGPLLMSNISSAAEAVTAHNRGAGGVGLFRTEFLYMGRDDFPSEDEQLETYRAVISAFDAGTPIVIRTMDAGGDKPLALLGLEDEDNPFLGVRGMRISLKRPELLRTQLRALLRASDYGNIKLLFPMISTLGEWRRTKAALEEAKVELARSGIAFDRDIEMGIMIEVPSAAMMADRLAREADFFSIGTNDLVQYTMAANRNSASLGELHDPLQPAVLRLIHRVIRAAHDANIKVSVCGEMAAEAAAVPLLLGMGLNAFSVSNDSLSSVGRQLRQSAQWDMDALRQFAEEAMDLDDASDVRRNVEFRFPELRNAALLPDL